MLSQPETPRSRSAGNYWKQSHEASSITCFSRAGNRSVEIRYVEINATVFDDCVPRLRVDSSDWLDGLRGMAIRRLATGTESGNSED